MSEKSCFFTRSYRGWWIHSHSEREKPGGPIVEVHCVQSPRTYQVFKVKSLDGGKRFIRRMGKKYNA